MTLDEREDAFATVLRAAEGGVWNDAYQERRVTRGTREHAEHYGDWIHRVVIPEFPRFGVDFEPDDGEIDSLFRRIWDAWHLAYGNER